MKQNTELKATNSCRLSCWFSVGSAGLENFTTTGSHLIHCSHPNISSWTCTLCLSLCGHTSCELILHDSSTEWSRRAQRFPVVSLPSSIKHTWTPYLWSVHEQQLILHLLCSQESPCCTFYTSGLSVCPTWI